MPYHHVMRFQVIAPSSAARMTSGFTIATSIIPLPIVFATPVSKRNRAAKLNVAAHATAVNGLRTRVPTMVAIEFAESWNPLM